MFYRNAPYLCTTVVRSLDKIITLKIIYFYTKRKCYVTNVRVKWPVLDAFPFLSLSRRFSFMMVKDCHECMNKHVFCHSCIVAWTMTSGQNSRRCPLCRCEQTTYARNRAVDRQLEVSGH